MAPPMRAKQTPTAPPPAGSKPDPWAGPAKADGAAAPPGRSKGAAGGVTHMKLWYAGAAMIAFGIVDIVLYIAVGWDITGVPLSAFGASIVGGAMIKASTK